MGLYPIALTVPAGIMASLGPTDGLRSCESGRSVRTSAFPKRPGGR